MMDFGDIPDMDPEFAREDEYPIDDWDATIAVDDGEEDFDREDFPW